MSGGPNDLLVRVGQLEADVAHFRQLFLAERAKVARLERALSERASENYAGQVERRLAGYKDLFRKANAKQRRLEAENAGLRAKLYRVRKVPGVRGLIA